MDRTVRIGPDCGKPAGHPDTCINCNWFGYDDCAERVVAEELRKWEG
jgi:hypothetical protein